MKLSIQDPGERHARILVRRLELGLRSPSPETHYRIYILKSGPILHASSNREDIPAPCASTVPIGTHIVDDSSLVGWLILVEPRIIKSLLLGRDASDALASVLSAKSVRSVSLEDGQYAQLEVLVRDIETERQVRGVAFESVILARFIELIVTMCRIDSGNSPTSPSIWNIEDVMRQVQINYREQFSLAEIAGRCALTQSSFTREFKRVTGSPLFEYINNVRIKQACTLLKQSKLSVLEISYAVGYNNVSFFNRYFRRIMGVSPTRYRTVARG